MGRRISIDKAESCRIDDELLSLWRNHADIDARSRLVLKYRFMVLHCALRVRQYTSKEDAEQEGYIGLIKAIDTYNPCKARIPFYAFAKLAIRNAVYDATWNRSGLSGVNGKSVFYVSSFMSKGLTEEEAVVAAAEKMRRDPETVRLAWTANGGPSSIFDEDFVDQSDNGTEADMVDRIHEQRLESALGCALAKIDDRLRMAVMLWSGGERERDAAAELGVAVGEYRQLVSRALGDLRSSSFASTCPGC